MNNSVSFPDFLPIVLDMMEAPSNDGIWIKRKPSLNGEIWNLVTNKGITKKVSFPPKRTVIGFSKNVAYATIDKDNGYTVIEKYNF